MFKKLLICNLLILALAPRAGALQSQTQQEPVSGWNLQILAATTTPTTPVVNHQIQHPAPHPVPAAQLVPFNQQQPPVALIPPQHPTFEEELAIVRRTNFWAGCRQTGVGLTKLCMVGFALWGSYHTYTKWKQKKKVA